MAGSRVRPLLLVFLDTKWNSFGVRPRFSATLSGWGDVVGTALREQLVSKVKLARFSINCPLMYAFVFG